MQPSGSAVVCLNKSSNHSRHYLFGIKIVSSEKPCKDIVLRSKVTHIFSIPKLIKCL